jgi:hypothetical protein
MKWKIVASPARGQLRERQSSHPVSSASGRLKIAISLDVDGKDGSQPEGPRPITFAAFSSKMLGIDHPLQNVDANVEIGTDTLYRQVDDGRVDLRSARQVTSSAE